MNKKDHTDFMWRGSFSKANEVEAREKYHIEVSKKFAALEYLDTEVEANSAWETIRQHIKISAQRG
jgi:hypothetical protein